MEIFGTIVGLTILGVIITLIVRAVQRKKAEKERQRILEQERVRAERERLAAALRKSQEDARKKYADDKEKSFRSLFSGSSSSSTSTAKPKTMGATTGRYSNAKPNLKSVPKSSTPKRKKYDDYDYDNSATTNALLFGAVAASTYDYGSSSSSSNDSGSSYSSSSSSDYGSSSSSSYDSGSSSSSFDSGSSSW